MFTCVDNSISINLQVGYISNLNSHFLISLSRDAYSQLYFQSFIVGVYSKVVFTTCTLLFRSNLVGFIRWNNLSRSVRFSLDLSFLAFNLWLGKSIRLDIQIIKLSVQRIVKIVMRLLFHVHILSYLELAFPKYLFGIFIVIIYSIDFAHDNMTHFSSFATTTIMPFIGMSNRDHSPRVKSIPSFQYQLKTLYKIST